MQIAICYHKPTEIIKQEGYLPIQCGRAISSSILPMVGDDTGNNISEKNDAYSELTALYWLWKNIPVDDNIDILGLCHYRRFFDFHHRHLLRFGVIKKKTVTMQSFDFSVSDNIKLAIMNGSVVVAKPRRFSMNNIDTLATSMPKSIIRMFDSFFLHTQDVDMCIAYREVMYKRNYLMPYNMFLMQRKDMDKYCVWLFHMFEEFEKQINMQKVIEYRLRIFGYLSERMFNVWLLREKKDLVYVPVVWFDDNLNYGSSITHRFKVVLKSFGL